MYNRDNDETSYNRKNVIYNRKNIENVIYVDIIVIKFFVFFPVTY